MLRQIVPFFRDVLDYPFVDAGHDWLIFALPPAELAVHPAEANGRHELFLMCDDLEEFTARMSAEGVICSDPRTERWGSVTEPTLPGGGALGVYVPTHPSPPNSTGLLLRVSRGAPTRLTRGGAVDRRHTCRPWPLRQRHHPDADTTDPTDPATSSPWQTCVASQRTLVQRRWLPAEDPVFRR
jgi:hypothetical protein